MKVLRWLDENFEKTVCIILFMVFSALMIINVIMRFAFASALPWATELVLFLFVWFVMIAMSYGLRSGAHVKVDVLVRLMPEKAQKIMLVVTSIMVLALFGYLCYTGFVLLGDRAVQGRFGLLIRYPLWSLYLSLPVGMFLCSIRITQNIIQVFKKQEG